MKAMKKVLAMVLALAMIVTAVPVTNAAADTANLKAGKTVSKTYYAGRIHTLKLNGVKASDITKTTWKSNNTAVVKCITDTKTKTSTNIRCVKKGTATVTAKVTLKNKKTKTYKAKITVKATTLTVSQEKISLKVGESKDLTVTYQPKSAKVTYSSNNPAVATVAHGKVTATGQGDTRIVVKLTCGKKTIKREVLVSVEPAADGIDAWLTNPMVDDMVNTVMVSDDAVINVQYVQDGKPVAGKNVILKIDTRKSLNNGGFDVIDQQVVTDENGIATFIISANKDRIKQMDIANAVSRIVYKAVIPSDGVESAEKQVDFAAVTMKGVAADGKLTPAEEFRNNINWNGAAFTGKRAVVDTENMGVLNYGVIGWNNIVDNQYIMSQQVSEYAGKLTDEHEVSFDGGYPVIWLPAGAADTSAAKYQTDPVNETSQPYGVYGYNTSVYTYTLKVNPTLLTMATLNFEKVSISEHTYIEVRTYKSAACAEKFHDCYQANDRNEIDFKVYRGPLEDAHFGYQVPLGTYNGNLTVAVKIVSQGQVDLGMNAGYTLKDVDYVFRTNSGFYRANSIPIVGSKVDWEMVDSYYTAEEVLYPVGDRERVEVNGGARITIPKGGYVTRKIPVFPKEGNAILTVYDINHNVVAYYAQATSNNGWNVNAQADPGDISGDNAATSIAPWTYLITEEEVADLDSSLLEKGKVSIRPDEDGRKVWVNSAVSGRMNLQGTVTVPAKYQKLIDDENNKVWTFVQWNPTPNAGTNNSDFEALIGQYIDVYAQLYDKNDNKVTKSGVTIRFSGGGNGAAYLGVGDVLNGTAHAGGNLGKATVVSVDGFTNAQGQAKMTLLASEYTELLNIIATTTATTMYNVKLIVGGKTLNTNIGANLWWGRADIGLTPCANGDCTAARSSTDDNPFKENYTVTPNVGTNWEYGLTVTGHRQAVVNNTVVDQYYGLGGLDLQMKQVPGTVGDAKTIGAERLNVIHAKSDDAGTTSVLATIDDKSINGALSTGKTYAGRGATSERKNYTLNIQWGAFGLAVKFETVNGNRIYDDAAGTTTWETVYVMVTGKDGKTPVPNTKVRLNIKTNNGNVVKNVVTDAAGTAHVLDELQAMDGGLEAYPGNTNVGGTAGRLYTVDTGQGAGNIIATTNTNLFTDPVSGLQEGGVYTTTDKYGIARVMLKHLNPAAGTVNRPAVTVVTAVAEGLGEVASMPYYWVDVTQMNGGLSLSTEATVDGKAYKTNYDNNTGIVTLEFTSNIVPTSVKKEMFKVEYQVIGVGGAIELRVDDVTVSNNVVSIKLKDKVTNMTANSLINVTLTDYTALVDPVTNADTKVQYILTSVNGARYTGRTGAGATVVTAAYTGATRETVFTIDNRKTPTTPAGTVAAGPWTPLESRAFVGTALIAATSVTARTTDAFTRARTAIASTAGTGSIEVPVTTILGTETATTIWTTSDDTIVDLVAGAGTGLYGAVKSSSATDTKLCLVAKKTGAAVITATTTYKHVGYNTTTNQGFEVTDAASVDTVTWLVTVVGTKFASIKVKAGTDDPTTESNNVAVISFLNDLDLTASLNSGLDEIKITSGIDVSAVTGASIAWTTSDTDAAYVRMNTAKISGDISGYADGDVIATVIGGSTSGDQVITITATVTWNYNGKEVTQSQTWKVTINNIGKVRKIEKVES